MDIERLKVEYPMINRMALGEPIFWVNPKEKLSQDIIFKRDKIDDAEARLNRFASYIKVAFPETQNRDGIIESDLVDISAMKNYLEEECGGALMGRLMLKCDSHLPVSGSIKARGGIYEVLKFAEGLALDNNMITLEEDYGKFADDKFRNFFSNYSVSVGSTGNLGLSIGIISAKLGFKVTVHMSADARQWKKDLLRQKGVVVIEYKEDYAMAVAQGRREAELDSNCHFVDDESSRDLFLGYSVAARRLVEQFKTHQVQVDEENPLFVYLPCGVGGAPGGVTYGLKSVYGDNVHCFFAEPTQAPCMTLGLMTGLHDGISVGDIGLDGKTAADGLAVSRPSALVSSIMESQVDGCFTVKDNKLYPYLSQLADTEGIFIEPSACAAFPGPCLVEGASAYLSKNDLYDKLEKGTHLIWATGGSMVPKEEMGAYYKTGKGEA